MKVSGDYKIDGIVKIETYMPDSEDKGFRYYYSPSTEYLQKINMPFDDVISNIDFKDGVASYTMFASKSGVFSTDMFDIIQHRAEELNAKGYKTFEIEDSGWGSITRTWYVWSKEKTEREIKSKRLFLWSMVPAFIVLILVLSFFVFL